MPQDYQFSGTHHITITVRDMEKSLHFYRDMVGLKVRGDMSSREAPNSHLYRTERTGHRLVTFDAGGGPGLALAEYPDAKGKGILLDDVGITHFSLTVSNLKEFTERMLAMGAKPPSPVDAAFSKDPFFIDPDGILVYFNGPGRFQIPQDQGAMALPARVGSSPSEKCAAPVARPCRRSVK